MAGCRDELMTITTDLEVPGNPHDWQVKVILITLLQNIQMTELKGL